MPITITTASGRTRQLPDRLDVERVAGLDEDGRIVVDDYSARTAEPLVIQGHTMTPFMFGLTLCCDASDKGIEEGVVCRACYGTKGDDTGNYLYRAADGSFPGLDPIASREVTGPAPELADLHERARSW